MCSDEKSTNSFDPGEDSRHFPSKTEAEQGRLTCLGVDGAVRPASGLGDLEESDKVKFSMTASDKLMQWNLLGIQAQWAEKGKTWIACQGLAKPTHTIWPAGGHPITGVSAGLRMPKRMTNRLYLIAFI
jgi:hypothetical protein